MAEDFGTPMVEPKKKRNTTLIVIVVLILLCCCCVFIGAASTYLWNFGDQLLNGLTGQVLNLRV